MEQMAERQEQQRRELQDMEHNTKLAAMQEEQEQLNARIAAERAKRLASERAALEEQRAIAALSQPGPNNASVQLRPHDSQQQLQQNETQQESSECAGVNRRTRRSMGRLLMAVMAFESA